MEVMLWPNALNSL